MKSVLEANLRLTPAGDPVKLMWFWMYLRMANSRERPRRTLGDEEATMSAADTDRLLALVKTEQFSTPHC